MTALIDRYITSDSAARWRTALDRARAKQLQRLRGIKFIGSSEEVRATIKTTILQLPQQVQDFAFRGCIFICMEHVAFSFPADQYAGCFLVFLWNGIPTEFLPGVVAHEIAHGWSGSCEESVANN